jgi:hypothetical protein
MKNINATFLFMILCITISCKAQTQVDRLNDYTSEIIGIWLSNDDADHKIEFTSSNDYKIFIDDNLEETFKYYLNTSCGSNSNNGFDIFLKIQQNSFDQNYSCHIINNITTTSQGDTILSVTTERGKLELYTKQ